MSSNTGASSRVSIPNSARKMIQNIKEIIGNHSDEDVYAMLKECSMDPDETAQRLMFLDPYHEVKRKRDKRKENMIRGFEESRQKSGNQGRGARSGRGGFTSPYMSYDAGGGRNTAVRKENGFEGSRQKGTKPAPPQSVSKEANANTLPLSPKTPSIAQNGPDKLPTDGPAEGQVSQISEAGGNQGESKSHQPSAELKAAVVAQNDLDNSVEFANQTHEEQHRSTGTVATMEVNCEQIDAEENFEPVSESSVVVNPSLLHTIGPSEDVVAVEEATSKLENFKFADGQHVIIPNHIQVPDEIKSALNFGSLDMSFRVGVADMNNSNSNQISDHATTDSLEEEAVKEETSGEQYIPSTAEREREESSSETLQASVLVPETAESKVMVPNEDQTKQEISPTVGPPYPVQNPANYSYGFMPPMLGNPVVPIDGVEHQIRLTNSAGANSLAMPSPTPTPPPAQSVGPGQSSVAVSAQPVPLFRQAYPPNYIPYNPYFSPIYVPPALHQIFGPGGFPPQLQTGNMYMQPPPPPGASQASVKIASSHFKGAGPTSVTPNHVPPPVGFPSPAYGVCGPSHIGYGHGLPMTSGSSNNNEDLVASALKENNVYLGQQSEGGSAVWIPAPGRDSSNMAMNSFFNLSPALQGQHMNMSTIAPPQPGLGVFPTLYHHPLQAIAAAASPPGGAHALLHQHQHQHQQSQSLAGPQPAPPVESVVGPSPPQPSANGYQQAQQQPQRQSMNWSSGF